jgi:hypothetical protein
MPQTAAPIKSAGPFSMVAGSDAAGRAQTAARMAGGFVVMRNSISKVVSDEAHWLLRGMDAR